MMRRRGGSSGRRSGNLEGLGGRQGSDGGDVGAVSLAHVAVVLRLRLHGGSAQVQRAAGMNGDRRHHHRFVRGVGRGNAVGGMPAGCGDGV